MASRIAQFFKSFRKLKRSLPKAEMLSERRNYVSSGINPVIMAQVFREADVGNIGLQAELFEQMEEKDTHLLGERNKRTNAIREVQFTVRPLSEHPRDTLIAKHVEEFIGQISDYGDALVALQDSVGKGFAMLEIPWIIKNGHVTVPEFKFVEQSRLTFVSYRGTRLKTPMLLTDDNVEGVEIPKWKTIFHSHGGMVGHPTQSAIFRACAWMWMFKNYSIKDWVSFSEAFGMPLRIGKYPRGARNEEIETLKSVVSHFGSEASGVIPDETNIQFIEASKSSQGTGPYESLINFCNREISKALTGTSQSSDNQTPGTYASDKVKEEVRRDLVKADSFAIASTIRRQLITPYVGFNFGWNVPVPKYTPDWEEQEDLNQKADWISKLSDIGVAFPQSYIFDSFGIPEPQPDEKLIVPRGTSGPEKTNIAKIWANVPRGTSTQKNEAMSELLNELPDKFHSEPGVQKPVDAIADKALKAEPQDHWGEIEFALKNFEDMNSLYEALIGMELSPVEMGRVMGKAMQLAHLMGRYDGAQ